jgi:L-alanine-DL-glutamate epimerase-like enolase superfamily enzyme
MTELAYLIGIFQDPFIAICPHSFRIGPATYASMPCALSQPNMDWMEVPLLQEEISFPAKIKPLEIIGGEVFLPDGPGWGFPEF